MRKKTGTTKLWYIKSDMASRCPSKRIIKNLSPEQVSQALASWMLVQNGMAVDRKCKVELQFAMTRSDGCPTEFNSCRVDIEIE